jgi:hypothetical protein
MGSLPVAIALQNSRSVVPIRLFPSGLRQCVGIRDNQWPEWVGNWGPLGAAQGGGGQLEFWLYSKGWRPIVCLDGSATADPGPSDRDGGIVREPR